MEGDRCPECNQEFYDSSPKPSAYCSIECAEKEIDPDLEYEFQCEGRENMRDGSHLIRWEREGEGQ